MKTVACAILIVVASARTPGRRVVDLDSTCFTNNGNRSFFYYFMLVPTKALIREDCYYIYRQQIFEIFCIYDTVDAN